jgi:hypothetical protein
VDVEWDFTGAIATIKPQLSILVILWFILDRRWRILGVAAGTILLLCLIPAIVSGPFQLPLDWFSALAVYKSQPPNSLGWIGQAGLQNAIYLLTGIALPNLFPLAIGITLVLWGLRSQLLLNDIFGVLPMLSLLFGYGHYYDVIVLSALVPLFWRHMRQQSPAKLLTLSLLFALVATFLHPLLNLPDFAFRMLLAVRSLILLGLGILLLLMSYRKVSSDRQTLSREYVQHDRAQSLK